jgi:hypothetical protein
MVPVPMVPVTVPMVPVPMVPVTVPMVPVTVPMVPVAQHWPVGVLPCPALLNGLPGEALQQPEENARLHAYQGPGHSRTQHA